MIKCYCEACGERLDRIKPHKCPPIYFGRLTVKAYLKNRYLNSKILEMSEVDNENNEWPVVLELPTGAVVRIVVACSKRYGYLYNKRVEVLKAVR